MYRYEQNSYFRTSETSCLPTHCLDKSWQSVSLGLVAQKSSTIGGTFESYASNSVVRISVGVRLKPVTLPGWMLLASEPKAAINDQVRSLHSTLPMLRHLIITNISRMVTASFDSLICMLPRYSNNGDASIAEVLQIIPQNAPKTFVHRRPSVQRSAKPSAFTPAAWNGSSYEM
jgi:hypothetical protein